VSSPYAGRAASAATLVPVWRKVICIGLVAAAGAGCAGDTQKRPYLDSIEGDVCSIAASQGDQAAASTIAFRAQQERPELGLTPNDVMEFLSVSCK
jgi:hypothetical protein